MYSGDAASWCLAHGKCATMCMLLVRFHMSSLHPSDVDKRCIMTRHTIHSSVCTWTSETLQPRRTRCALHRPTGITGANINAEMCYRTGNSRLKENAFNAMGLNRIHVCRGIIEDFTTFVLKCQCVQKLWTKNTPKAHVFREKVWVLVPF